MKASVVIASYKRNELLEWNLKSLQRQASAEEIIVCDENPEWDGDCSKLAAHYGCVYVHTGHKKEQEWRVPGFAFNKGAKFANHDVLVLSCAEVYHPYNTLDLMMSTMEEGAIAIPRCIRDDKGGILAILNSGGEPSSTDIHRLRALDATLPFFMAMSKKRFFDIGGYDEDFTGVCWDDNDLTERLVLSGGRYKPVDADVIHLFHPRHNYRSALIKRRWNHNKALYDARRGQIVRNQNREWGQ